MRKDLLDRSVGVPAYQAQTPGMALQALNHELDDSPVPPAPRSRFARVIRKVTALYQDGVQRGKRNGQLDGNYDGVLEGFHDVEADGIPNGDLEFVVRGDTVWPVPQGHRPLPNAKEHAEEFLAYLQLIQPLPGRWISAWSLQFELYPRFLQQVGWPAQAWLSVAHQFRKLSHVRKRQRDRRCGADREGTSPTEYFIPRPSRR